MRRRSISSSRQSGPHSGRYCNISQQQHAGRIAVHVERGGLELHDKRRRSLEWSDTPTIFVNSNLLTAAIPAGEVATPGPDNVTVVDTSGTSNALTFAVPCVIPTQGGSSQQTRARVGAYYFDGWSGPLTNFHFQGLPLGPFQDR